ncbi:hypothetical protein [Acidianus brierleyi]|uniref:Uncharacterized protein n=1 Tax=Acidianus brierleyi TaxID=41673 RepID=A0A2U9IDZ3_9CREN|nr:hypothetical protein [Acidianus brierleyi]AWR94245.1 hypothetical protein DFR85_06205 [Acidianus brierleyi]
MRALSDFLAFIIILLIIVGAVIPLFLYLNSIYPQSSNIDYSKLISNEVNGGTVLIYYNASPTKPEIEILKPNSNYTLISVFIQTSVYVNISKNIYGNSKALPLPLIYNFTMPNTIGKMPIYEMPILLEIRAFNTTNFIYMLPNETGIAS